MGSEYILRQQNPTNTAEQWSSINPILLQNELGFESDTRLFKIGDGQHHWTDLPYSKSADAALIAGKGIVINHDIISARLLYEVIEDVS